MPDKYSDMTCTVCGCACDDLTLTVEDNRILHAERACYLAQPWFAALAVPLTRPTARIEGKQVSLDDALARAAEILNSSRSPLIWGLSRSSTPGQRAAAVLAEKLGATIDTTSSCQPGATLALQKVGQSTSSLGEVRNRADLVIFWRTDPLTTHPRHLERYSVDPTGLFVPNGRADRTVVVVDTPSTKTRERADLFVQTHGERDLQMLEALRSIVGGDDSKDAEIAGVAIDELRRLAELMRNCRYGAIFFGPWKNDLETNRAFSESIFQLARDLNKSTRFTAHYMGGLTGAENVLCWQTGFPFAINFANGYPTYSIEKFSANALLEVGGADACLLVGSESTGKLSPRAQERLKQLPTIALDYPNVQPGIDATIQFTTSIYGIHTHGTAYRMDGIPIPLRAILSCEYPTDDDVLDAIAKRVNDRLPQTITTA